MSTPYMVPDGYGGASNRHLSLDFESPAAKQAHIMASMMKYFGNPSPGFDKNVILEDQYGVADSLIKKWGGAMDLVKNRITQAVIEFSPLNTIVLPFKYARSLKLQMPIRTISRPMMQRVAEHAPARKLVTSQEMVWEVLSRHAIAFNVSSEVLMDSPIGQDEYFEKMKGAVESLRLALEHDALEQLVMQVSYEFVFMSTRPTSNARSTAFDVLAAQISNYCALSKPGNGMEYLMASAERVGNAIGVKYNSIIARENVRQQERATNPTTREIMVRSNADMAKLGGPKEDFIMNINCLGNYLLHTHTPQWDEFTKTPGQCPLTRQSATASLYRVPVGENGPGDIQIMDHHTHAKVTITGDNILQQLKSMYTPLQNDEKAEEGEPDAESDGALSMAEKSGDEKPADEVVNAYFKMIDAGFMLVIIRPCQVLNTSSIVFAGPDIGNTYLHLAHMAFGNDPNEGYHAVMGAAYFKAWVSNGRGVLPMHDTSPQGVYNGCGNRFFDNNTYEYESVISGESDRSLILHWVPPDTDLNLPIAFTKHAAGESANCAIVGNSLEKYDVINNHAYNYFKEHNWQTVEDMDGGAPGTQSHNDMTGRVPQYALPGACWTKNSNSEFTIFTPNTGHLGSLDSPNGTRALTGIYECHVAC